MPQPESDSMSSHEQPEVQNEERDDSAKPKKIRGKFKRKSDGELYELTVSPPHPITGRTHKAVNAVHTWEGSQMDFPRDFTKEDGTPLLPSV